MSAMRRERQGGTLEAANIETVRTYFKAIEDGAVGDAIARFFAPDVIQDEFPNRLMPNGARRNLNDIRDASERGQKVVSTQTFEIQNLVASGDWVAVETIWTGTLSVPFGTIPAGGRMRARFGVFIQLRDGKIIAQRNYDCFDPF
jgi:ketosteroid isomerase-like protein